VSEGRNSIDSLATLEAALWNLLAEFDREAIWWRGHANGAWDLRPSAHRIGDHGSGYDGVSLFGHFKILAPGRLGHRQRPSSEIEWLFLAQHYGLPTVLLDWTANPLTALYFVVSEGSGSGGDGCLYAFSPSRFNSAFADPENPGKSAEGLRSYDEPLVHAMAMQATGFKDEAIRRRLFPHLQTLPPLPKAIALAGAEMDERIVAQAGRFTLHRCGDAIDKLPASHEYLRRFVVPGERKNALRTLLQTMGIERWSLFPDLQALADGLRRREFGRLQPGR